MPLKLCRECGHEVSDEAAVCPDCGCKHPARSKNIGFNGVVFILVALALIVAFIEKMIIPK